MRWSIAALALASAPAIAETVEYRATLDGNGVTNRSGSSATANAVVTVDRVAQTVDIAITVTGLTTESLWDQLVAAPAGPIHLHRYATGDLADANSSTLAFPVPYGATFRPTATGFSVATGPRPYSEGMATLRLTTSFDEFLAAMNSGQIVLNIHTDAFNAGEISGQVIAAGQSAPPLPAYPAQTDHSGHH
jgi:hypothetical protein